MPPILFLFRLAEIAIQPGFRTRLVLRLNLPQNPTYNCSTTSANVNRSNKFLEIFYQLMIDKTLILICIGLLTGTITAMSAGSGVMIVVPLLVMLSGYSMHEAIGTSLLVDVIASINVAYSYYRYKRVDLKAGAWLAGTAVIGAQIGSHLASLIPQSGLKGGFSIFVIISGLIFWLRARSNRKISLSFLRSSDPKIQRWIIAGIGLILGLNTGIFGAGGGVTILLVLVYVLDFPLHMAIGTATAIMAVTAASGAIGYTIQGHIPWFDAIIIGIAAMVSGIFFTKVANRTSEKALNWAVGSIFIIVGIAMTFVNEGELAGMLVAAISKQVH
jgi:uncharacterized protein